MHGPLRSVFKSALPVSLRHSLQGVAVVEKKKWTCPRGLHHQWESSLHLVCHLRVSHWRSLDEAAAARLVLCRSESVFRWGGETARGSRLNRLTQFLRSRENRQALFVLSGHCARGQSHCRRMMLISLSTSGGMTR